MKKVLRNLLFILVVAAFGLATAFVYGFASESRRTITCKGLEVSLDKTRSFVSEQDIKDYLRIYYGPYIGERIDSVNLDRIETILDRRSAIRKSQAWTTDDGILHISITQREPVVRFQRNSAEGFYADESGYIFPLQKAYTPLVPVVVGNFPLKEGAGYKGEPSTPAGKEWMEGLLDLIKYMNNSKIWAENISDIWVSTNGDFVLIPREGKERFIFGNTKDIKEKFGRMEKYYEYIRPAKEEGWYRSVNVKYKDRIICRR
ncbi:MAG: cell division protein FtsQ/DivIB [Candidatus Cryptobacteroides sp.]|jgi:cell division protein FtsQ|nr:hypothetical protein [Rikenellaceae bacterium]